MSPGSDDTPRDPPGALRQGGGTAQIQDSCFDTVILPELNEPREDPSPVLLEAKRLCRIGGDIIITVPNANTVPNDNCKATFTQERLTEICFSCFGGDIQQLNSLPEQWVGVAAVNNKSELPESNWEKAWTYYQLRRREG